MKEKYAFVGAGVTRQGRFDDLTGHELAVQAVLSAIEDAGLKKSDIDGYICQQAPGGAHCTEVVRDTGIGAKLIWELAGTGTHGIGIFIAAVGALESGVCNTVAITYSTSPSTLRKISNRNPGESRPEGVFGLQGPVAIAAAWARRYMHLYGVTERHLGEVAVTLRGNANKRPEAMMHDRKITLEDYFKSKYIAEPLRMLDCCLVNDGAVALILTTAERAQNLRRAPVYIMGFGQDYSARELANSPESVLQFDGAITRRVSQEVTGRAGIDLKDIDVAQFYDAFTINIIDQLSGYGFCKRGEEGAFIEEGNIRLGGLLPCNTSGTELSWGYMHIWTHFLEAIRQLRGEAGECQVKDAEICLVTGGLSAIDTGLSSACFLLRR